MNLNHRKRLLVVLNNFFIGGVERLMLDVLSGLDTSKFNIEIATVVGEGPLEESFRALGFPVHVLGQPLNRNRELFSKVRWVILAPLTLWRLVHLIKSNRPDIVLTSLYQADLLGIFAARISGVKERILIQHDVVYLPWAKRIFKKYCLGLTTRIVAVSDSIKEFMVDKWKVPREKIGVIYNGINFQRFNKIRRKKNVLTIGFVGRLEKIKGPDIFANAILELRKRHDLTPNILLVGDGPMKQKLQELLGVKHVIFTGPVSNVESWFPKIDVLVVPSISDGFGLVSVEGLLSRCLVVVSDIPAFREIIDSKNGVLFPVGDHVTLAKILADLLTDTIKQNKLRSGIENWIDNSAPAFDIRNTIKEYEALLNS